MNTRLILIGLVALCTHPALAWDTKEVEVKGQGEREKWLSLYECLRGSTSEKCSRNEHELLAEAALDLAVSGHHWGIGARRNFTAIDLNASLFRPDLADLSTFPEVQDGLLPLERRTLPSPTHFAGIPDFSYTIYDWINKNELCPARPVGDQQPNFCHVYALWHGAGFNASHFGVQATQTYEILHNVALGLARDAAAMLDRAKTTDERLAHRAAIREAELLALAYEAYAQHFLSDRWAMGHMWNRWGAPEYNQAAYGDDIGTAVVTGLFTGVIHGFEAVTDQVVPDAMSSPEYLSKQVLGIFPSLYTPEWRLDGSDQVYGGVGDYRLQDMMDGQFGAEYAARGYLDRALDVSFQKEMMMGCLAASFGEVIGEFGRHPDGGIGIDRVRLRGRGTDGLDEGCLNPWATNRAIQIGWGVEGSILAKNGLGMFMRYVPAMKTEARTEDLGQRTNVDALMNAGFDRLALGKIAVLIKLRSYLSPDGIDLAQNGIGSYGRAEQAGAYSVASYFEPVDLNSLPVTDARGRDLQSIYGLFNRARAGYFCADTEHYLDLYRGSLDDSERAACRMLAQRMYGSTWPEYEGPQAESQSVAFERNRTSVRPLCQIAGNWTAPEGDRDATPYALHPGYVPWNPAMERILNAFGPDGVTGGDSQAYLADWWDLSNRSVAAWCDMVPVVDLLMEPADMNRDIAARINDADDIITLTGLHFGDVRGKVFVGLNGIDATEITGVETWSDRKISFRLGDQYTDITFDENKLSYIFVDRGDGLLREFTSYKSVGRFALYDDIPHPAVTYVKISRADTVFLEYQPAPDTDAPEDPGPFAEIGDLPAPPEPGPFRPINPGPVTVELTFDMAMAQDDAEMKVALGADLVTGEWINAQQWRGTFDLLAGGFFERRVGFRRLLVDAKAEAGGRIDTGPEQGSQPFDILEVLIDSVPIWVEEISITAAQGQIYAATWIGGPDLEVAPNLTLQVLNNPTRGLSVTSRLAPPTSGAGDITLRLSADIGDAPDLRIGGVRVVLTGEARDWQGSFDYAAIASGMNDGRIPIEIRAQDGAGKGLDGDPRTVSQIHRIAHPPPHWVGFEDGRGGDNSPDGGADTWHFLAAPVDLSFVIILDASGSMEDGGRMAAAKTGIIDMLAQLPEDKVIEVGAVVFNDCADLVTIPFTRDHATLAQQISGFTPKGGTALALAHFRAGQLFDASADPAAGEWRFVSFTDGYETCDGNVAAAAQALNAKTREHLALLRASPPTPPPVPDPVPVVECHPATWRAYQVEVEDTPPLDTISLIEHWYIERALPDGRCFARLETSRYYVNYGASQDRSLWEINPTANKKRSEFGTSSKGLADLDRVRDMAKTLSNSALPLHRVNQRIDFEVARALE